MEVRTRDGAVQPKGNNRLKNKTSQSHPCVPISNVHIYSYHLLSSDYVGSFFDS